MLSLPTELWLLIGAGLSDSDVLAAIQVNHTFYSQLIPLLYRNFIICGVHGGSARPPWQNRTTGSNPREPTPYVGWSFATIERLKRIQSSSMLMGAIKSFTLCHFGIQNLQTETTIADALKQVLQAGVAFISKLPHCRDIVIDSVHITNHQLRQLTPRPAYLSVRFRSLTILDGDSTVTPGSQDQCPLRNLTITRLRGSEQSVLEFAEWSMSGDIQSFSVQSVTENHLSCFRTQLLQRSFPNLRRLGLIRGIISAQVLECLPMLEELNLRYSYPPLMLTPTILPRLRTFRGRGSQARSIVPGRPIRALHILAHLKDLLPSSVGDEVPNFGSTMSIIELSVERGTPAEVIEQGRITRICPSLQVLRLSPNSFIKIDAVSVSGASCEEEGSQRRQNTFTTEYMHEFYCLKHLRHLDFKFLCHAPSNRALAWERSMCEAFRTRSAPNIHHVSFSSIVEWDRVPHDTTWIPSGIGVSANQGRELGGSGREYPFMAEAQWPDAPFPLDEQR